MGITNTDIMDKLLELETKIDADRYKYDLCTHCSGGVIPSCVYCKGTGFKYSGKMVSTILDSVPEEPI